MVVPTDTVYGVAARLDRPEAISSIFRLKERPEDKPLPVLGSSVEQLGAVAEIDERARDLAGAFWPGPLTLVLPRRPGFEVDLGGPDDGVTVGVRVPRSPLLASLLEGSGPLAVTSANLSGRPPAATVEEARAAFGDKVTIYLEEGRGGGRASTVVSLVRPDGFEILRPGPLSESEIAAALQGGSG